MKKIFNFSMYNYIVLLRNGEFAIISKDDEHQFIIPRKGYITRFAYYNDEFKHRFDKNLDIMAVYENGYKSTEVAYWMREYGFGPQDAERVYMHTTPSLKDMLYYANNIKLVINHNVYSLGKKDQENDNNFLYFITSFHDNYDNEPGITFPILLDNMTEDFRYGEKGTIDVDRIYWRDVLIWENNRKLFNK